MFSLNNLSSSMVSTAKNMDLKCSETLRDSPPPPPAGSNLPIHQPANSSQAILRPSPAASSSSTVSLFVRKRDSNGGHHSPGGTAMRSAELGSLKIDPGRQLPSGSSPSSLPISGSAASPSKVATSAMYHHGQPTYHQPSAQIFSAYSLPTGAIWPLVPHQSMLTQQNLTPGRSLLPGANPALAYPSLSTNQSTSLSSTLAKQGAGSPGRPLTLHVSTSKGPAVLQLQSSPATTTAIAKSTKILSAGIAVTSSTSVITAPPAMSSISSTKTTILRPSPVHASNMAAAAILSQFVPPPPAFSLVDRQLHQQHLQAPGAFSRSPNNGGGLTSGILPQTQISAAGGRAMVVSVAGSPSLSSGCSTTSAGFSSVMRSPASTAQLTDSPTSSATTAAAATPVPATPSPSRPSILRKRPSDMANGAGSSPSGSSAVKRLTYEPVTLARRANDVVPSLEAEACRNIGSTAAPEHPDAGNSNHSSSASTVSVGSFHENNGNSQPSNGCSPSPRKRQRKQALNELTSGGYGSEEDVSAPLMAYYCEPVEEETVVGSPVSGTVRYVSTITTARSRPYTMCLDQPETTNSLKDRYDSPKKSKVERRLNLDNMDEPERERHVPEFRRRSSLLAYYDIPTDVRRNHFCTHEEFKLKEEKKPSVIELCNQSQILQKIAGWKMRLIMMHFQDLNREENTYMDEWKSLLNALTSSSTSECDEELEKDIETLKEMVLTNIQRVRAIREQLDDGKQQLSALFKHKSNLERIIERYSTKRSSRWGLH